MFFPKLVTPWKFYLFSLSTPFLSKHYLHRLFQFQFQMFENDNKVILLKFKQLELLNHSIQQLLFRFNDATYLSKSAFITNDFLSLLLFVSLNIFDFYDHLRLYLICLV